MESQYGYVDISLCDLLEDGKYKGNIINLHVKNKTDLQIISIKFQYDENFFVEYTDKSDSEKYGSGILAYVQTWLDKKREDFR